MRTTSFSFRLAAAGLLAAAGISSAAAEASGAFASIGIGRGEAQATLSYGGVSATSPKLISTRVPLMFGAKSFINSKLGYRYGIIIDMTAGTAKNDFETELDSGGFDVFADALFNFWGNDKIDVGVFGGVSFGYAGHRLKLWNGGTWVELDKVNGWDVGVNVGARANFLVNHGVELYYHRGFLEQKGTMNGIEMKFKRPSVMGVRYVYSF